MGCSKSKEHQKAPIKREPVERKERIITIVIDRKEHSLDQPPKDLKTFKERVYSMDPVLKWRAWHPQAQLEQPVDIRDAEQYSEYIRNHGAKNFLISIIMEHPYPPLPPFDKYSGAIAMVLNKEQYVIGNAILITKSHVLISNSLIKSRDELPDFSVYFQQRKEDKYKDVVVPFRPDGAFIHARELEVLIIELFIESPAARDIQDLNPVFVNDVKQVPRNEQMNYLFNSSVAPVLKSLPNSKIIENDPPFYIIDKAPEHAIGAPLFYKDGSFAGVLLEPRDKKKRVLVITELLKYLRTREPGLVGEEYIPALLNDMNVGPVQGGIPTKPGAFLETRHDEIQPIEGEHEINIARRRGVEAGATDAVYVAGGDLFGDGEVAVTGAKKRFQAEGGATADIVEGGEDFQADWRPEPLAAEAAPLEEVKPNMFTKSAFAIEARTGGAIVKYHCSEEFKMNEKRVQLDMRAGYTFTSTPEGVLVVGGKDPNSKKAAFWTSSGLETLSDMPAKHCFHTATFTENNVYVISGEFSANLTAFNLTSRSWSKLEALPANEPRSRTGSCAWNGRVYLLGGVHKEALSKEILEYDIGSNRWSPRGTLNEPLADMGAKMIRDNELLVFGGVQIDGKETSRVYKKNLSSDRTEVNSTLPVPASFREFSPCLDSEFLVFSSQGKLFQLNSERTGLLIVSLPPVLQEA